MDVQILIHEHLKYFPDDPRSFFIYRQHPVFHIIPYHIPSKHDPFFHLSCLAPFDSLTCFPAFLLRDRGHDGQSQFGVRVERIDVVIHKNHPHTDGFEIAGDLKAVHRVSGKSGDLFCYDQIQFMRLCILDHPIKILPLFCGSSGNAFIGIYFHELPIFTAFNVFPKISLLTFQ